jgi:hypothetical protein
VDSNKYIEYRQTAQMLSEYKCVCNKCMNDIINENLILITRTEYLEKKVSTFSLQLINFIKAQNLYSKASIVS